MEAPGPGLARVGGGLGGEGGGSGRRKSEAAGVEMRRGGPRGDGPGREEERKGGRHGHTVGWHLRGEDGVLTRRFLARFKKLVYVSLPKKAEIRESVSVGASGLILGPFLEAHLCVYFTLAKRAAIAIKEEKQVERWHLQFMRQFYSSISNSVATHTKLAWLVPNSF